MNEIKEKNDIFIQDFNLSEKTINHKIFHYFYSIFHEKKENSLYLIFIQIIIETIQFLSYAFSPIHQNSWNIGIRKVKLIYNILATFRITIFIKFLDYKIYAILLYIILIFIFFSSLIIIIQILSVDSTSKLFKISLTLTRIQINIVCTIFYIPITEIILIPAKCVNGKVLNMKDGEKCWDYSHFLNLILGSLGAFLFFISCIFLQSFNFYPFQKNMSTNKINSNNDVIILIIKIFIII